MVEFGMLGYMPIGSYFRPMDRDVELLINGHLYEITTTDDKVIGNRQGFPAAETGCRKTLGSVADIAGTELVDEVAMYIKEHIETHQERPSNQNIWRKARIIVSKAGYPAYEYLNAARQTQ